MKSIVAVSVLSVLSLFSPGLAHADASSPLGYWETIDDDGVTPTSVMYIYLEGDTVSGRVVKILRKGADPKGLCEKCPGDLKDKPVVGMRLLWGMKKDGKEWSGGRILDPDSGKDYACTMRVDGDKLHVRGYIGVSLFGRTQVWRRAKKPSEEPPLPAGAAAK